MPTKEQLAFAERENRKYPWKLVEIPRSTWSPAMRAVIPQPIKAFRSREFLVQVYEEGEGITRLSCNRTTHTGKSWEDMITWDELQAIKRQSGYGDYDAVECYPPDKDVVNVTNMRHLFVFTDRRPLEFVWRRKITLHDLGTGEKLPDQQAAIDSCVSTAVNVATTGSGS